MNLITLDSAPEADYFLTLFSQNAALFDLYTHIGAVATVARTLTDWYWLESNQKVNFPLKFQFLQPDDAGGVERCLSLGITSGVYYFNDLKCYELFTYKFVCQAITYDRMTTVATTRTTRAPTTPKPVVVTSKQ